MAMVPVCLESGPRRKTTMVHVPDFLGCVCKGPTTDDALKATPRAIEAFRGFLAGRGAKGNEAPSPRWEIVVSEHVTQGYFLGHGSPTIIFAWDREPLAAVDLRRALRRAALIRTGLLELVSPLDDRALDARPRPEKRSIREILWHLVQAERAYVWAAFGKVAALAAAARVAERGEGKVLELLAQAREAAIARLEAATPEELGRTTTHGSETWTARKSVRRILEHEWEHLLEISEYLGRPLLPGFASLFRSKALQPPAPAQAARGRGRSTRRGAL